MKLYTVNGDYIEFLRKIDSKNVQHNYDKNNVKKPYIGTVINVNGFNYFAPLSCDKNKKYFDLKNSNLTVFKMIANNGNYLGIIKINNMIPISESNLNLIDVDKQQEKYKSLLNIQIKIINKNKNIIQDKAERLYNSVNKNNKFYSKISAKFLELEEGCKKYESQNSL